MVDGGKSSPGLVRSSIIVRIISIITVLGFLEDGCGLASRSSIKGLSRFVFDLSEHGSILLSFPFALIDNISSCFVLLERATLIVLLVGTFLLLIIVRFLGFSYLGVVSWIRAVWKNMGSTTTVPTFATGSRCM